MRIAVYCGSLSGNADVFEKRAKELGTWIGKNGHELVFGASDSGLMGAVANAVIAAGGNTIGVVPDVPEIKKRMHKNLGEYVFAADMSERKKRMIELSDAFIALPGGIGTLDEITEVICLSQLRIHNKPSVLFNAEGYYEPLKNMFSEMAEKGFSHQGGNGRVLFSDDLDEIGEFIGQ